MKRTVNLADWRVWEQNASPMLLTMTLNAGMRDLRDYFGTALWTSVIIFEENQGRWLFRPAELKLLGQKIIDFLLCPPYRVAFFTGYDTAEQAVLEKARDIQFSMDLTGLSDNELVALFEDSCRIYYGWYKYGWFCEPVQFRGQEILTAYMEKEAEQSKLDMAEMGQVVFAVEEDTFTVQILEHLSRCAKALAKVLRDDRIAGAIRAIREETGFPSKAAGIIISAAKSSEDQALADLVEKVKEHSANYYWKQNNYFSTRFITEEDVLTELFASEGFDMSDPASRFEEQLVQIRENKKKLLSKKPDLLDRLRPYYRNLVALMTSVGGSLIDQRKRTIMTANAAFDRILGAVAERTNTKIGDCRLLIPQELGYFVTSPEEYRERFEERKERFLVFQGDFPLVDELIRDVSTQAAKSELTYGVLSMQDPFIAEGKQVDRALEQLHSRLNLFADADVVSLDRLQGVTAYYDPAEPTLEGPVSVIRNPKVETLKSGEILVAPSTTPDYMNAIRLCKAIVTDWGGQTSHAAIASRELKKPCIIGVNYASQVLRNGDKIRLDLEHGIIEVLMRT
jgi:phosphohistidine swiveling domain-containing protein